MKVIVCFSHSWKVSVILTYDFEFENVISEDILDNLNRHKCVRET